MKYDVDILKDLYVNFSNYIQYLPAQAFNLSFKVSNKKASLKDNEALHDMSRRSLDIEWPIGI